MRNFVTFTRFSVGMALLSIVSLGGCGGDVSTPDMAVVSMSCCGKLGDVGNSKGVGQYCTQSDSSECRHNTGGATICSVLGDTAKRKTTFCTMTCDVANVGFCGENASCTQDSATKVYGCTPNACTATPPPGCSA